MYRASHSGVKCCISDAPAPDDTTVLTARTASTVHAHTQLACCIAPSVICRRDLAGTYILFCLSLLVSYLYLLADNKTKRHFRDLDEAIDI